MAKRRPVSPPPEERALLLSCMDLRLLDEIVREMEPLALTNRYDHVILAGAALGAITPRFPHWGKTFKDHLKLARQLHDVKRVIVLDHRDCGAYRLLAGLKPNAPAEQEREVHLRTQQALRKLLRRTHPDLAVELWLMDLEGKIEDLSHEPELPPLKKKTRRK